MNQPSTNLSRGLTHLLLYDKQRGDIVKITAGVSKLGFIRISSSSHFISYLHKNSSTEKLNDSFTDSSGLCIMAHYDNLNGSSYKASVYLESWVASSTHGYTFLTLQTPDRISSFIPFQKNHIISSFTCEYTEHFDNHDGQI